MDNKNLSMLCDFYELTMSNGYFKNDFYRRNTYFDVFFRSIPDHGGFAIAAGLEQIVEYIQQLHFTEEDIAYLRSKKLFDQGFLDYLRSFRFTGDLYAVPDDVAVCRCENVSAADIREAGRDGLTDINEVKLRTRAGMGNCQGRTCGPALAAIAAETAGRAIPDMGRLHVRSPLRPVPLSALLRLPETK